MAAVEVRGVSKRYRLYHERNQSLKVSLLRGRRGSFEEFWALRDVTFDIPEGTTFGLIGENGSGKSTLLKCMARILRPDEGRIAVHGKVSALLELGAGFHPELSGRENVYLNGSILGLGKKELDRIFDDIVGFAGLEQFIDMPVKVYSSGMYVRLGFSVAINVDPDVLLVDEVLAVGDEEFQRRCGEKFADLKASGKTIVIVSHALGSVRNLCDQVAWLEHGVLKDVGEPGNVVDSYVGEVHAERAVEDGDGSRWGSGEGRVDHVEILDAAGSPTAQVRTGDQVTIRFHYTASTPIERPVFGMAVHRIDGVHVTGPNTREAGCVPDRIEGSGVVDLRIDRLLLLPGTYDVSASLYDYSCLHAFDFRHRAFRFDVESGEPREEYGLVSLGGQWDVDAMRSTHG
ncbi:MAG TPA: ABC transporter ATP-binding protein [Acidimicrobiales bacterium]|nr:ABC transporter ATP-binding protein [Acidimicrobiales bacterium]